MSSIELTEEEARLLKESLYRIFEDERKDRRMTEDQVKLLMKLHWKVTHACLQYTFDRTDKDREK